jgi:hypothetical protein
VVAFPRRRPLVFQNGGGGRRWVLGGNRAGCGAARYRGGSRP